MPIKVSVMRVTEAEATGSRPIGSANDQVVKASDLGPGPVDTYNPYDSYELVLLKYADVSEIIGLLVEGQDDRAEQRLHPARAGLRFARRERHPE